MNYSVNLENATECRFWVRNRSGEQILWNIISGQGYVTAGTRDIVMSFDTRTFDNPLDDDAVDYVELKFVTARYDLEIMLIVAPVGNVTTVTPS